MARRPSRDPVFSKATAMTVLRWSAGLAATFALCGVAGFGAAVAVYSGELPRTSELREQYRPMQVNRFYGADGSLVGVTFEERRSVVPMSRVPPVMVRAVLGAEDADFFEHQGLDYPGILRAMWINVRSGRRAQGASTITQQVVRTFYLGREKTFSRKFKELLLARRLEQNLSKEEILFLYLNQIYFGHGRHGIGEAARFYLGKEIEEIDLAGAALLAGLPKGPEIFTPFKNPERARSRRDAVLAMMVDHGLCTAAEAEAAREVALPIAPAAMYEPDLGGEFVDEAQKVLVAQVGEKAARQGGYHVYTTMDPRSQKAAREAVADGLSELDARRGYRGPVKPRGKKGEKSCREWPSGVELGKDGEPVAGKIYAAEVVDMDDAAGLILLRVGKVSGVVDLANEDRYNPKGLEASSFIKKGCRVRVSVRAGTSTFHGQSIDRFALEMGPQALVVALDPVTREVKAMIGGHGYVRGGFNRALRALRQPGSAFKPFVYLAALRSRAFTPASIVDDAPVRYDEYRPENYETWQFEGPVRLRKALVKSINVVAVRLIESVGPAEVVELAASLGIRSKLEPELGLALGSSGVRPLELANAYATIASGGVYAEVVIVKRIVDPFGKDVALRERRPAGRVITEAEAWLITSMMTGVISDPEGTGRSALKLKRPAAGKTGTSDQARDAWFAGFVPQLTAVVWVGFDDYKSLGKKESGAKSAVPIWTRFMRDALQGQSKMELGAPPEGIVSALVDPATGKLAWDGQPDAIEEFFLDGTVPTEQAFAPELTTPEDFMMNEGLDEEPQVVPSGLPEVAHESSGTDHSPAESADTSASSPL